MAAELSTYALWYSRVGPYTYNNRFHLQTPEERETGLAEKLDVVVNYFFTPYDGPPANDQIVDFEIGFFGWRTTDVAVLTPHHQPTDALTALPPWAIVTQDILTTTHPYGENASLLEGCWEIFRCRDTRAGQHRHPFFRHSPAEDDYGKIARRFVTHSPADWAAVIIYPNAYGGDAVVPVLRAGEYIQVAVATGVLQRSM